MDREKRPPEDDNRTIADMSGIERPAAFLPRFPGRRRETEPGRAPEATPNQPEEPLSPEDRRLYIFAALKAALLIAGVFIAGLGLVIWLMLALWT